MPERFTVQACQTTPRSRAETKKPAKKKRSFLRELPILIGVALVLSLLIKTFLVQAFFIPSESMEKTLHGCPGCTGDRILVEKVGYRLHDPNPGDIVVFRAPSSWEPEAPFAKPSNPLQRAAELGRRGLRPAAGEREGPRQAGDRGRR